MDALLAGNNALGEAMAALALRKRTMELHQHGVIDLAAGFSPSRSKGAFLGKMMHYAQAFSLGLCPLGPSLPFGQPTCP
jgi:hypothetical protein